MKKYLLNRKVQKFFLPASAVCLFPLWLTLLQKKEVPLLVAVLGILAVVFFVLDRFFKPWELERAEAKMKKTQEAEQRYREERAAREAENALPDAEDPL